MIADMKLQDSVLKQHESADYQIAEKQKAFEDGV